VPGEAYESAQPDGEREEVEQEHVCDPLFCARLPLNRNVKNTENQSDCGEEDKDHGLPPSFSTVLRAPCLCYFRLRGSHLYELDPVGR
jgi:hypothetical protein